MDNKTKKKLARMKKAELVEEVTRLTDENESLWLMLDEMKSSEMKNYKGQFQNMINRKVKELHYLARKPLSIFSVSKKK